MVESRCGLICGECEYRKEPYNFGGCVTTNGNPFYGVCKVATCCQEKGFGHCGHCSVMPCETLHFYSYLDKEHRDKPPGARIEVLKKWLKEGN
jgi:hypothetical protein